MNELVKVLRYSGNEIRTEIDENGDPWFCLKDLCDLLDIKITGNVASELDDDEKKTIAIINGTPGNPNMTFVSESGLYSAINKSRKPEAKEFRRWVRKEVLPAIRKTGGYLSDAAKANPTAFIDSLSPEEMGTMLATAIKRREADYQRAVDDLETKNKALAHDKDLLADDNTAKNDALSEMFRENEALRNSIHAIAKHAYRDAKQFGIPDGSDPSPKARDDLFSKSSTGNVTRFPDRKA